MTLRLLRRERHLVAVEPRAETLCAHDLHITHDGRRLGLFVHPSGGSASLSPCPYVNEDGL